MGADPADAARVRPLLDHLCRKVEHCGPVGTGAAMKLAINLPLMVAWQAYGEAFAIARSVGWDAKRLVDLFVESNGGNKALAARAEMIVKMLEGQDPGATTFSIANGLKDLRTMVTAGEALGADMLATRAALAGFADAVAHGQGGGDGAQMTAYWSGRKKTQPIS
jgi:3-hydroxyisobutyrate dehydrogenase